MAQGTRKAKRPAATRQTPGSDVQIGVSVPQNTSITVSDLKNLDERAFNELIDKVKAAKVGFIILNAPFKVRTAEPVS